jgi:hypothetical protein
MLPQIVAVISIIFGAVGVIGLVYALFLLRRFNLNRITETISGLDTTIENTDEFLSRSASMVDGIASIFYDIGTLLPLAGRPFRKIGSDMGSMAENIHNFRSGLEKAGLTLSEFTKQTGNMGISRIVLFLIVWLIGLHSILIMIGAVLLYL